MPCESTCNCGSMPQTFSPQTSVTPLMAAPTAKCSQFLRAISVEPNAPVKTGAAIFTFRSQPYRVSTSTAGKTHVSGLAAVPTGKPSPPRA